MKRKVIQIADSTQLVSLPRKWAVKNGIKKGDEVDVIVDNDSIRITPPGTKTPTKQTEIELDGMEHIINRVMGVLYKIGYDEITARFENPEIIAKIQESLQQDMIGYEIVEQHANHCIIKAIATTSDSDFDIILRRTYLLLKSMLEGISESMKSGDKKTLPSLRFLERTNNKYTAFCRRVINKNGYKGQDPISVMYCLIEELEKLADQGKYLCDYLSHQKTAKVEADVLELFNNATELYQHTYELHYTFESKKLAALFKRRDELVAKGDAILKKGTKNTQVVHYAQNMVQSMANMWSFELTLKL